MTSAEVRKDQDRLLISGNASNQVERLPCCMQKCNFGPLVTNFKFKMFTQHSSLRMLDNLM